MPNNSLYNSSDSTNSSLVIWLAEPSLLHVIIGSLQAIISFTGTIICLLAFATLPALRTPFNYYLIDIFLAQLVLSFCRIFMVVEEYHGYWPFGVQGCTGYVIVFHSCAGIAGNGHLFISINRAWAMFFPLHYRTHNSKAIALFHCVSTLIAVVPFVTAVGAVNEPYLPEPLILCRAITYRSYALSIVSFSFFVTPVLAIMVMYPFLFQKQRERMRTRPGAGGGDGAGGAGVLGNQARKPVGNSFLVLTWVAINATVIWAPAVIYFLIDFFMYPKPLITNQIYLGLIAWMDLSNVLDPILFIATVPPLRAQVKKLLGFT